MTPSSFSVITMNTPLPAVIAMNEVKKQSPVHSSWLIVAWAYVDLRSRNDAFFFFRHHDEYTTCRRHCDERSEEAISCS